MRKLEYNIRGLCWLIWMIVYVGLAAWVGEGTWDDIGVRFVAALCGYFWAYLGFGVIELLELPQSLAKAMLEDD